MNSHLKINKILEGATRRPLEQTKQQLQVHLEYLQQLYEDKLATDPDYRSGADTYGYASEELIIERLDYISDRWRCSFRIKWLIDLITTQ